MLPWTGLGHPWAVPAARPLSVPSCPREQLKSLPRAELEGRLESTLIIIEALSLQLRDWQESQRPLPGVGPAEQRDALTQTDVTHPKGVRVLVGAMPPCSLWPWCCDGAHVPLAVRWPWLDLGSGGAEVKRGCCGAARHTASRARCGSSRVIAPGLTR